MICNITTIARLCTETEAIRPSVASETAELTARAILLRNLLELDVQELEFSNPVKRVMRDAWVCTVGDLIQQSESKLLRWRGLGRRRVQEIQDRLQLLGLTLGEEPHPEQVHPMIKFLALSLVQRNDSSAKSSQDWSAAHTEVQSRLNQ